jgi:hypothetical protein
MNEPTQRNGFALGDAVRLPCMETIFEVIGLKDPSLVEIRAPSGHVLKAGWRTLIKIPTKRSNTHDR